MKMFNKSLGILAGLALLLTFAGAGTAGAASPTRIDADVDAALERFYQQTSDGKRVVQEAKGVLVFPVVVKAGFIFGGEYGEGALRIGGRTVDYYSTAAGSFGFQIGAQKKTIILLFMQDEVLDRLRQTSNWKAGADASIAVITLGAGGSVDSQKTNEPIIAFITDQKGLMYNLTLEGTKFTKLDKSDYRK
jgi:lipid-binding SYLF domain-containing protein